MTKRTAEKPKNDTVNQGDESRRVSPGNPPKEYQWKPGQSGNPQGQPKHRTHLWTHYCRYMEMTNEELAKLDRSKLTAAQQTALKLVEKAKAGRGCGAERMARYIVDREHGKAAEHLFIGSENDLTDAECDEVRRMIQGNHASNADK